MSAPASRPQHPTPEQLASVPLFKSLSPQQLSDLAELIEVSEISSGRVMVSEGASGYSFYVLAEGTAEVRHGDTTVRTLGPQDYFGEAAIIEKARRSASVVAVEPCVVWSMFGTTFRVLETEHPDIAKVLLDATNTRRDSHEASPRGSVLAAR
jgi:CRP-like cAMP-binding protein